MNIETLKFIDDLNKYLQNQKDVNKNLKEMEHPCSEENYYYSGIIQGIDEALDIINSYEKLKKVVFTNSYYNEKEIKSFLWILDGIIRGGNEGIFQNEFCNIKITVEHL